MKKILKLTSLLAIIICIALTGSVYATSLNCDLAITTSKNDFSKGEEFTASVYLSNVSGEQGAIAMSATLEYDKNSLKLIEMSGQNGWDNPTYNEANGKLVLTRSSLTKNNEVVFNMKFKINDNSAANPAITLKDATFADGYEGKKSFSSVSKAINVAGGNPNQNNNSNNNNNNQGTTNNNGQNNNQNQNKPIYNDGNTKPDMKYDRTNITGKNGNNKPTTQTPTDSTQEPITNTETSTNTTPVTTTPSTDTTSSTTTVSPSKTDGEIPKAGLSSFSMWLIIFTIIVIFVSLVVYGIFMAVAEKRRND